MSPEENSIISVYKGCFIIYKGHFKIWAILEISVSAGIVSPCKCNVVLKTVVQHSGLFGILVALHINKDVDKTATTEGVRFIFVALLDCWTKYRA